MLTSGERFKEFLKSINLTQKSLADYLECYQQDISKMINGQIRFEPYAQKLYDLGLSLDWLFTGDGEMFASNEAGEFQKEKIRKVAQLQKKQIELDKEMNEVLSQPILKAAAGRLSEDIKNKLKNKKKDN